MIKNKKILLGFMIIVSVCLAGSDDASVQALNNYEKQYEVMMNNVVNAQTPGFRASQVVTRLDSEGKIVSDVVSTARRRGQLIFSGDPLYVAIDGPGFYMIQTPSGILYTRDGRFKLNKDSQLATLSGEYPVLGEGGPITIPGDVSIEKIAISDRGLIIANDSVIDRLLVGDFQDFNQLSPLNGTFFSIKNNDSGQFIPLENFSVRQYYYEGSNVDMAVELMSMPNISKKFDANSKALQIMKKIRTTGREMGNPQ